MKTPALWLSAVGVVLLFWPQIHRLILPNFKSGIPWERIIWGHRPDVLPRLLGAVCILVGYLLTWDVRPTITLSGAELQKQIRWEQWFFWGLMGVAAIVILLAPRLSKQQEIEQRWTGYFSQLSPKKRILIIVVPIVAYVLAQLAWSFVHSVTRSILSP